MIFIGDSERKGVRITDDLDENLRHRLKHKVHRAREGCTKNHFSAVVELYAAAATYPFRSGSLKHCFRCLADV